MLKGDMFSNIWILKCISPIIYEVSRKNDKTYRSRFSQPIHGRQHWTITTCTVFFSLSFATLPNWTTRELRARKTSLARLTDSRTKHSKASQSVLMWRGFVVLSMMVKNRTLIWPNSIAYFWPKRLLFPVKSNPLGPLMSRIPIYDKKPR